MMRQKKFTELTEWQKLVRLVAKEHPEYKSNRQRVEEAKRIWRSTRPVPSMKRKRLPSDKYSPPPPPNKFEARTEWERHYCRVAEENPELVTTKAKFKLAKQLWILEKASEADFQIFLEKTFS